MRTLPSRMQDKLYNDQFISSETLRMRKKYRRFAEEELFPQAYQIGQKTENNDNFPWKLFRSMAEKGFFKVPFKRSEGGLGLKYPACAAAVLAEELAYISASFARSVNAHFLLAGKSISFGAEYIRKKYLKPLLQSGSDVRADSLITKGNRKGKNT